MYSNEHFKEEKQSYVKSFQGLFARHLLPELIVITLSAITISYFAIKLGKQGLAEPEKSHVQLVSESLNIRIENPISHLKSIIYNELGPDKRFDSVAVDNKSYITQAFFSLLSRNPDYAQIRWIDNNGLEVIRVQKFSGYSIKEIEPTELQDKSNRYYVKESLSLLPGQFYISPLDLNVEYNKIEIPYNPMIRLGTRVYDSAGRPKGVIILNISAKKMLDDFAKKSQSSPIELLNKDGYWLVAQNKNDEWGFMFGIQNTFNKRYPEAWKLINSSAHGQVENSQGIWTWETVKFKTENLDKVSPIRWKVVSFLDKSIIQNKLFKTLLTLAISILIITLFAIFNFTKLLHEINQRKEAEKSLFIEKETLKSTNQKLESEIIERQRFESELRESNAELNQFAYVASHDLKAPLRGIQNLAEWIEEDVTSGDTESFRKHIKLLSGRASRLESLLASLLEYYRAGQLKDSLESVNCANLLNEIWEYLSPKDGFSMAASGELPTFETFKAPIELVFRNLINNALKHHDKKTGKIVISALDKGQYYEFHIKDDGAGVPPEFHKKIFELFQTLKPRDTVEGSGMGLAIVRKTILSVGGEIWIESTPSDLGSEFIFTWPKKIENP